MPVVRDVQTINAGVTVANIMAGNRYEFLPAPALVRIYAVCDTVAEGEGLLTFSLTNAVLADAAPVPVVTGGPNRNENLLAEEAGVKGDRVIIALQNTAAAANGEFRTLIDIIPA